MNDGMQRRESGRTLVVAGWVLILFGFLVLFFYPSAVKVGSERSFQWILALLGAGGLALIIAGRMVSRRGGRSR